MQGINNSICWFMIISGVVWAVLGGIILSNKKLKAHKSVAVISIVIGIAAVIAGIFVKIYPKYLDPVLLIFMVAMIILSFTIRMLNKNKY